MRYHQSALITWVASVMVVDSVCETSNVRHGACANEMVLTDFSYRFFAGKSIREWRWLRGSGGQIYRGRNRRIRRNRRILTFEMSICQSCYGISPFPVSYYRHLRELHFYVFILLFSGTRNTRIYSILPLITWTSGNYLFGVSLRLTGSFPRPQIAAKLEFPARSRYCTFRMIYAVFLT